ncbi:hypothetical protein MKW98_007253 [Papaver atlanticum]|uniref:UDP-glycosyltransferase n=1 Tax=Papaver atlanticum TaxID=357466 RepID=A0AAD4TAD7_9MAGN|nr:hypothetical protein MKW98_007253 [Papaver atlanticum]
MEIFYSIWINQPQIHQKDSQEILIPDFSQIFKIPRSQLSSLQLQATDNDTWSLFLKTELSQTLNSDGFLINTIEEFDQFGLSYFKSKLGQNSVWAVGPVSDYSLALKSKINTAILYISFGSQETISKSQIMKLAIGLEKSDKNFIWVIRPPLGFDMNEEFRSEWLPEGFEERMKEKNKGLLVRKWAPQLEILSHKSTSDVSFGVPIIGWPLSADQPSNSRLLEEEMGVCVELAKGNRNEVKHKDVVRVLDLVMNKKDHEMRKKAFKVREMIKNANIEDEGLEGSSVKGIKKFFEAALLRKKEMVKMGHHGNHLHTTSSEI